MKKRWYVALVVMAVLIVIGAVLPEAYGGSWSEMAGIPTINGLYSVWGSSGSDVFAVGNGNTIIHYNGSSWSTMASGTQSLIIWRGVWGTSGSNVYAVGNGGAILHYNGSAWASTASPVSQNLLGIWGSSANDIFAVGNSGTVIRYTEGGAPTPEYDFNGDGTSDIGIFRGYSDSPSSLTSGRIGVWGYTSSDTNNSWYFDDVLVTE